MVATQDTHDNNTPPDTTDSHTDSEDSDDPIDVAIEVAAELSCDLLTDGVTTGLLPDYISDDHPVTATVWAVHPTLPTERDDVEDSIPRNAQSFLIDPPETDSTDSDTTSTDTPTISVEEQFLDDYHTERILLDAPKPWDITDNNLAADEDAESYPVGTDWDEDEYAVAVTPNVVIKSLGWEEHHYTFDDDRSAWVLDATGLDRLREIATDAGYNWQDHTEPEPEQPNTSSPASGDRYILSDEQDALDRATKTLTEGDEITIRYEKKNGNGIGEKEGVVETVKTGEEEDEYGHTSTQGIVIRREDGRCNKIRRDENDDTPCVYSNSQYPFMGELLSISFTPIDTDDVESL